MRVRYEALLERVQNPARLVGAEVGAGAGFGERDDELKVALAFPDAYEIGIANQALHILYGAAQKRSGVGVERAYLPWVDVIAEMRADDVPLLTWETWTPVRDAQVLGITLQHELNYTNVLELLDLARISVRSSHRGTDEPLVLGGGPAVANFAPLLPFLDAVVVGEGEQIWDLVLQRAQEQAEAGWDRQKCREKLASLEGVFVPGISARVVKQVFGGFTAPSGEETCLVPLTEGVHDRAWVEVMRGCSRGCRFCQAGFWYRPVRERRPERVVDKAVRCIQDTGFEEVSLSSLSTTDYTGLETVLKGVAERLPDTKVSLPSLRVDSAAVKLGYLVSPGDRSITLAPEAGSQRMRDVVNKNITDSDIMEAVQESLRLGRTVLKLYFMIGLPTEEDSDVQAIVDLCHRIRSLGREILGERKGRLQLNVSVTNFIPKPFTPFQWEPMGDLATLKRRQEILRDGLGGRSFRLSVNDPETSYVEAVLARGGVEISDALEDAWRRGARFDSWSEQWRPEAWSEALKAVGVEPEAAATAPFLRTQDLPWDMVLGVVHKDFLWEEREKALSGDTTSDCRWNACSECGACVATVPEPVLVHPGPDGPGPDLAAVTPSGRDGRGPASENVGADRVHQLRFVLSFSVLGRSRFLSHLDRLRVLRQAVRRAGGRLELTKGMRPKPILSLALPLAVGVESRCEIVEFVLAESPPEDFFRALADNLPDGMDAVWFEPYHAQKSVTQRVTAVRYRVECEPPELDENDCRTVLSVYTDAVQRYTSSADTVVDRVRRKKRKLVDVKKYVEKIDVAGDDNRVCFEFWVKVSPQGTARPEEVVDVLTRVAGQVCDILRMERLDMVLS